jgi:hypothetical protein
MVTRSWSPIVTVHWQTLRVQTGDPSFPITLTGPNRLVELFHWRRGKASPGVWVIVNAPGCRSPRIDEVEWTSFPVAEAQQEMIKHDERCSRFRLKLKIAA